MEQLFGRPLRSNPLVISLTPDNREEFLGLVREDFGRKLAFVPLICALSLKELADHEEKQHLLLDVPSIFTPRFPDVGEGAQIDRYYRYRLKELAGETPSERGVSLIASPKPRGMYLNRVCDGGLLIHPPSEINDVLLHELVHAEDSMAEGRTEKPIQEILDEGRAYFAQGLYCFLSGKDFEHTELDYLPYFLRLALGSQSEEFKKNLRKWGILEFLKHVKRMLNYHDLEHQLKNYPFMAGLVRLSKAVGDPMTAFQIATEKPPTTRLQIEMPLTYYRKEIARARQIPESQRNAARAD